MKRPHSSHVNIPSMRWLFVVQMISLLKAKGTSDRCCIELVGHYGLTLNGSRSSHIVVGHAHEITGVAFVEKFGDGPGSEYRDVIGVRLNGNQDLASMRLSSTWGRSMTSSCSGKKSVV